MALAEDPIARYEKLVASATPRAAPVSPGLEPATLYPIIQATSERPGSQVSALSEHLARHSRLTFAEAHPMVANAIAAHTDPTAKAEAVSRVVASATSANIELSDPVMLNPGARVVFAGLLFAALLACIGCIAVLGETSSTAGSALIGLAVVAVLCLIGILVLVMGYKNVTIKGAPPTG